MLGARLVAGSSAPLLVVDGADFDGTDWMQRGATLTGIADGKSGIFSCWVRMDSNNGTAMRIFCNAPIDGNSSISFLVERGPSNNFVVDAYNAGSIRILNLRTEDTPGIYTAGATWYHILSSWDLAAGAGHLYVNDVNMVDGTPTLTNDTINYTVADWDVGASDAGFFQWHGCIAELYFVANQYLDFSLVHNRRKFISASGKPVVLGTDGSLPLGTTPNVYLHLDNGEAVANFATNRGSGGNFSLTGTLVTASSSPSD